MMFIDVESIVSEVYLRFEIMFCSHLKISNCKYQKWKFPHQVNHPLFRLNRNQLIILWKIDNNSGKIFLCEEFFRIANH